MTMSRTRLGDGTIRVIRRATPRDVTTIVRMIRHLADYEKLTHEVRVTAARIRRHGFGPGRYFETLLCEEGGRAVGFALYFFTYSTFLGRPTVYLEDLFVLPEARGRGAGKALLRALARLAVARGCGRMEWTVLDWNAPAIQVYERLGAALRRDWILTRLTGSALRELAAGRDGEALAARGRRARGTTTVRSDRGRSRRGAPRPRPRGPRAGALTRSPSIV